MKHRTSTQTHQQLTATPLTHLSVRELLQRLAACADVLRADPSGVAAAETPEAAADRGAILHQEVQLVRELRRRRHFVGAVQGNRRHSAAWPPPPW